MRTNAGENTTDSETQVKGREEGKQKKLEIKQRTTKIKQEVGMQWIVAEKSTLSCKIFANLVWLAKLQRGRVCVSHLGP